MLLDIHPLVNVTIVIIRYYDSVCHNNIFVTISDRCTVFFDP